MKQKVSKNFPRPCTFPTVTISETWRKLLLNFKCPGSACHLSPTCKRSDRKVSVRNVPVSIKPNLTRWLLQSPANLHILTPETSSVISVHIIMIIAILTKAHTKKSVNIDSPYFTFPTPASFWKTHLFICICFVFVKFWTV